MNIFQILKRTPKRKVVELPGRGCAECDFTGTVLIFEGKGDGWDEHPCHACVGRNEYADKLQPQKTSK